MAALARQQLCPQPLLQVPAGTAEQLLSRRLRGAEHQCELRRLQAVPCCQVERLAFGHRQFHDGIPRHETGTGITLIRAGRRLVCLRRGEPLPALAFHAGKCIEPQPQSPGVLQAGHMRLGDYEGVTGRDLGRVTIAQHEPAELEEPLAVGVKEVLYRAGLACTQGIDKLAVTHSRVLVTHSNKLDANVCNQLPVP
jgi:hypothetical protein